MYARTYARNEMCQVQETSPLRASLYYKQVFSIKYQNKNRTKLCDKRANEKEYEISCRFDFIFGIDKETFQAVL